MGLAANLKRLRIAKGFSQNVLAKKAGVSQQLISQIEIGDNKDTTALPQIARALEVAVSELDPEYASSPGEAIMRVPLISWVAAGRLAEVEQIPIEDAEWLTLSGLGNGDYFALRVNGDSMDRFSPDGSIIVVNAADRQLVSGKGYIFALNGETTYKLWRDDDPPYLEPFSHSTHRPIFVRKNKGFSVLGRVRRSILEL